MTRPLVLIVEDDTDLAEGLREVLEERGYEVSRAANGVQALFALDGKLRPAVIVLDLMMPIMDGQTFRARQLERHEGVSRIPVIGWSAYDHFPVDFPVLPKAGGSLDRLLDFVLEHAGPGVPEPPPKKRPPMSARKIGAIAAALTGLAAILKTILDIIFPPKGHP